MSSNQPAPTGGNLPQDGINAISSLVAKKHDKIAMFLGKSIGVERWTALALRTISKTPALLKCKPETLYMAMLDAATLQLEVDGVLGHAYIVPYKGTAQMQIGYKGYQELARRSGKVRSIQAEVVYEGDIFEWEQGATPKLVHKVVPPSKRVKETRERTNSDTGEVTKYDVDKVKGFYAVVRYTGAKADNGSDFVFMWLEEVEAIRKRSPAGNNGPWVTDFVEMGKKTAVRRLAKILPLSNDAARSIAREEQADAGVIEPRDAEYEDITMPSAPAAEGEPEPAKTTQESSTLDKVRAEHEAKKEAQRQPPKPAAQEPVRTIDVEPVRTAAPAAREPEERQSVREETGFAEPPKGRTVNEIPIEPNFPHFGSWKDDKIPAPKGHTFENWTWNQVVATGQKGDQVSIDTLAGVVRGVVAKVKKGELPSPNAQRAALALEQIQIHLEGKKGGAKATADLGFGD